MSFIINVKFYYNIIFELYIQYLFNKKIISILIDESIICIY